MAFARSATECLACKTKRKKCDETKPHCLRCQKSHIECPGYIYVQNPNKPNGKLRTVPAPRTALGRSQATEHYEVLLVVTEGPGIQSQAQLAQAPNTRTLSESHDMPNVGVSSSSLDDSLQHSSIDYNISHELVVKTTIPDPIRPPPSMSAGTPMTSGQAVYGDPCVTPRVQGAFKRYLRLLNETNPGRFPDQYLSPTLPLICPAALQKRDREVIRRRVLGLCRYDRIRVAMCITEDYWARVDTEGRPVVWSDIAVSIRQVLDV